MKIHVPFTRYQTYGLLTLIAFLVTGIVLQSRAFTFSFTLASICFIAWVLPGHTKNKRFYFIAGLVFLASLLLVLSLFFKTGSTSGRLLVYKISYPMFIHNWVHGIGYGTFKSQYLLYQANYFKDHQGTVPEMLLAGNTYYAFNDYWHFIIEGGICSMLVVLAGIVGLFCLFLRSIRRRPGTVIKFIWCFLLALLVAASFTHLWEKWMYVCMVAQLLLIILLYPPDRQRKTRKMITASVLSSIMIFGWFNWKEIWYYRQYEQYEQAQRLCYAGYASEGMDILEKIYPTMKHHAIFLSFYGMQQAKQEKYKEALRLFKEAQKIQPSNELYRQIGTCYDHLGDFEKAQEALIQSVYMVPNRFVTRYELFMFYKKHKHFKECRETGQQLLSLPVKVPSSIVNTIRSHVQNELTDL